ncbi:MAG: hypothetical protein NZ739_09675 [Verrucomicrobiae bacterium]|nr:hypothetical protein [Verrucomicrobiae bacterium]MDW7979967.1 hypothetical protein [Verrucomicrobiales bacterium]
MIRTRKLLRLLALASVVAGVALNTTWLYAQQGDRSERRRGDRPDFDPAEMRERIAEGYRELLEFTNEEEWNAVKPLVVKVLQARWEAFPGMGRGMFRPPRRGGEGPGASDQDRPRPPRFGPPSPATEALEQALESKASTEVIKAKLAALREERKQRQEALQKAQEDLRKVLNTRREALAVLYGLLD